MTCGIRWMMVSLQMHAINVKAERRVPSDTFCSSLRNRLRFPCPCVGFATKPLWADHHKGIEDSSMLMCRICLPARHRVSRKLFHCQQAVACLQKKKRIPVQKAGSVWSPESGQSSLRVCPRGTDLEPVFWAQKWDLSFGSLIPKFWTRLVRFFFVSIILNCLRPSCGHRQARAHPKSSPAQFESSSPSAQPLSGMPRFTPGLGWCRNGRPIHML